MPEGVGRVTVLFLILVTGLFPVVLRAQFYGSVYSNFYHTSNIFGVDTAASAEAIWENSFSLGYQFRLSPRTSILTNLSYSPELYLVNSGRSYSSLYFSGEFRLRIGEQIAAGALTSAGALTPAGESASTPTDRVVEAAAESPVDIAQRARITEAVYYLYDAVSSLDSLQPKSSMLVRERDSVSEILFTVADLLDSNEYGSAVKTIVLDELYDAAPRVSGLSLRARDKLASAITLLKSEEPSSTFDELLGSFSGSGQEVDASGLGIAESSYPVDISLPTVEPIVVMPNLRVPLSSQIKNITAESITLQEDAWTPGPTTYMSLLGVPIYYSDRRDGAGYISLDYHTLSGGLRYTAYPSQRLGLYASLSASGTRYPNDSVYSNTETTFDLEVRIGVGSRTAVLFEAGTGLRRYTSPLTLPGDPRNPRAKPQTLASSFSQYSFGGGVMQDITSQFSIGLLGAFTRSPDLRAYLIDVNAARNRFTSGISDDEYTYDMSLGTLLAIVRIPYDIDLGFTARQEHRTYGALVINRRGKGVNDIVGASRIEDESVLSIVPSRYFFFEGPLFGLFETLRLRAELEYRTITSSLAKYSYEAFNASLSFELTF